MQYKDLAIDRGDDATDKQQMNPGSELWKIESLMVWQQLGMKCPLVVIKGTPAGDPDKQLVAVVVF